MIGNITCITIKLAGRDIANKILDYMEEHSITSDELGVIGGDATAVNSGPTVSRTMFHQFKRDCE